MLKIGKFAVAAVLCLVMTLALLTTGAFAQSATQSAVSQASHTATVTVNAHPSWWWRHWGFGGWGGLWGGWFGGLGGCGCCGGFWW